MRLDGRRESSNIEDMRGSSGGFSGFGGGGGGGNLIAMLLGMLLSRGGSKMGCGTIVIILIVLALFMGTGSNFMQIGTPTQTQQTTQGTYQGTAEEEALALFTSQILASTEDVWTREFEKIGRQYQPPTLVMYTDRIQTGCGTGSAAMGPFYCSADQKVYIDLSFFQEMHNTLGADGDFAYAYVIAHEVGHHVQNLLGDLHSAHQRMAQLNKTEANRISVQIELQADFYAGIWGHYENKLFNSLEKGDLEEALITAQKIGDDYLQKKAQGYSDDKTYTHGTSVQRERWFKRGWSTGDITQGNTFEIPYNKL